MSEEDEQPIVILIMYSIKTEWKQLTFGDIEIEKCKI